MALKDIKHAFLSLPNDHPLHIVIRTYPLALSLSLGPTLLSFASSPRTRLKDVNLILQRELSVTAFPFAITVALGGSSALRRLWNRLDQREFESVRGRGSHPNGVSSFKPLVRLKPWQKSFVCNLLASLAAITLLQPRRRHAHVRKVHIPLTVPISHGTPQAERGGRMSATLDLTLLVLVRAFDALVQGLVFKRTGDEKKQERKRRLSIITKLDALVFWASSAGLAFWPFLPTNCQ
jgi:hypothetical protein